MRVAGIEPGAVLQPLHRVLRPAAIAHGARARVLDKQPAVRPLDAEAQIAGRQHVHDAEHGAVPPQPAQIRFLQQTEWNAVHFQRQLHGSLPNILISYYTTKFFFCKAPRCLCNFRAIVVS